MGAGVGAGAGLSPPLIPKILNWEVKKIENPKTETTGSYKVRVKKKTKKIAIIVVIVLFSIEIARNLTDFILGMGAEFITYRDFESLKLLDEFAVETDPPKDPGL